MRPEVMACLLEGRDQAGELPVAVEVAREEECRLDPVFPERLKYDLAPVRELVSGENKNDLFLCGVRSHDTAVLEVENRMGRILGQNRACEAGDKPGVDENGYDTRSG